MAPHASSHGVVGGAPKVARHAGDHALVVEALDQPLTHACRRLRWESLHVAAILEQSEACQAEAEGGTEQEQPTRAGVPWGGSRRFRGEQRVGQSRLRVG